MSRQASSQVDRPAPGHYQRRLSAAFNRLPAQMLPPLVPIAPLAERRVRVLRVDPKPSPQLALPLEAVPCGRVRAPR